MEPRVQSGNFMECSVDEAAMRTIWKRYERRIFDEFVRSFPQANIQRDVRLAGRYSHTLRQIDIHVGGIAAGVYYQIIVDTKCYNKKVDVKVVEEFIGMLGDLDCNHGMLITEKGYTEAAANRAAKNPFSISIDIISHGDLKSYQTSAGVIAYADRYAVLVRPPLGWVIDDRPVPHGYFASMYSRSFPTREAAFKAEHSMYLMLALKSDHPTMTDLIASQELLARKRLPPETSFANSRWKSEGGRHYSIRTIYIPGRKSIEITAFADFQKCYYYAVMLTPLNYTKVNFPRLIYVMDGLIALVKEDVPATAGNREQH